MCSSSLLITRPWHLRRFLVIVIIHLPSGNTRVVSLMIMFIPLLSFFVISYIEPSILTLFTSCPFVAARVTVSYNRAGLTTIVYIFLFGFTGIFRSHNTSLRVCVHACLYTPSFLYSSYGDYGYGCSNQFENAEKTPAIQIAHSMFCRVAPPLKRIDVANDVMTSINAGHPDFINFGNKVDLVPEALFTPEGNMRKWSMISEPTEMMTK